MADDTMASRLQPFRRLVLEMEASLKAFHNSGATFQVLRTVYSSQKESQTPSSPSKQDSPKTLLIMDSSFNPPSIAHQSIVRSVLERSSAERYANPLRLLLLFAVTNADKEPSPASFQQRLTMMTIFAQDLIESLESNPNEAYTIMPIDIGITTSPYYTDKSAAIANNGLEWYPDLQKHLHLVGFDSLSRIFAAKYYKSFKPPFSALTPYFAAGHRLRVTLRPDEAYGNVAEQKAFLKKLSDGDLEQDGAKREWAEQVELVPPNPKAGVSSTRIREAAKKADWETVGQLCTPTVAQWVWSEGLYADDG